MNVFLLTIEIKQKNKICQRCYTKQGTKLPKKLSDKSKKLRFKSYHAWNTMESFTLLDKRCLGIIL